MQYEIPDFFKAYDRHFSLSSNTDLEKPYNSHFHQYAFSLGTGYKVLKELHSSSKDLVFSNCRSAFEIEIIENVTSETHRIEQALTDNLAMLVVFITNPNISGIANAHSVTIGRDVLGYYIYDVNFGQILPVGLNSLQELSTMNDGILMTSKS
jgi:hypothetical protein